MQITIKDIARRANVSTATVSRVINNNPFVKVANKKKVMSAIKEMNYNPNLIARSMVKKRTFSIGLIIGSLSNPYYAESAEIIIKVAERYNFHVNVYVTDETKGKTEEYIDILINRRVDGALIGSALEDTSLQKLEENHIPYVLYNRKTNDDNNDYVIADNFKGTFDAINHLIQLGHKKIGIIHGPDMFVTVKDKIKGYYKALDNFGLKKYDNFVEGVNFFNTDIGVHNALTNMMSKKIKPTAIFTTSDYIALGVMNDLHKHNIHVPKDIALIGCDNIKLSGHSLIELTTIDTRSEEISRFAAEKLLQKIEDKDAVKKSHPWCLKLETKLIIRKSCGSKS